MDLFIESADHKVYDRTYLLLAKLRLNFTVDYDSDGVYEAFERFFENEFKLPFDRDKYKLMRYSSLSLSNNHKGFNVKFRNGYVRVEFSGGTYRSYKDSIAPILERLVRLIAAVDGKIIRVSIQKVNAWDFGKDQNDVGENMCKVLNPGLTEHWKDIGFEQPERGLTTTMTAKDPSYLNVVLSFGYVRPDDADIDNRIVLDSEGLCDRHSDLEPERISDTCEAINTALYNIYHWAVTPAVIESME